MKNGDMTATFQHTYTTRFLIDESADFARLPEMDLSGYDRVFFVFEKNVAALYRDRLLAKIGRPENEIFLHEAVAEERTKSIVYYPTLVSFFESHALGRYDAVVAVGGGIIIDLVSFTVSTYMRGIPLFIIATTLIGQTDASTAGKTCLNSANTKNLLGTFYYPKVVYNSIEILRTSPRRITRQGLSEAFKYSLLTDGVLLDTIVRFQAGPFDAALMREIVESTIRARVAIRQVDPLASNLGHTFGHALEKYYDYQILHGDAILIGTVMAIHYAAEQGLMTAQEREKILSLMRRAKLNVSLPETLDVPRLIEFMRRDKKSSAKCLHLVMLCGIGRPYRGETPFYEAAYDDVARFLLRFVEQYPDKRAEYISYLNGEDLL